MEQYFQHSDTNHWLGEISPSMIFWDSGLPYTFTRFFVAEVPESLKRTFFRYEDHEFVVAKTNNGESIPLFVKTASEAVASSVRGFQLMQRVPFADSRIDFPILYGVAQHNDGDRLKEYQILEYVDGLIPISLLEVNNEFQFRAIVKGVMDAVEALLEQSLIMDDFPLLHNFGYVAASNSYWVFDIESIAEIAGTIENKTIMRAFALKSLLLKLDTHMGVDRMQDIRIRTDVINQYLDSAVYIGDSENQYLREMFKLTFHDLSTKFFNLTAT